MSQAAALVEELCTRGIAQVPPLYGEDALSSLRSVLDPLFERAADSPRSYIEADELMELGLLDTIFNDRMTELIRCLLPDPQIYHCKIYETAANQKRPHINASLLDGWHRDEDTIASYSSGTIGHLSVFVYLSDVQHGSGAFEILPQPPSFGHLMGEPSIEVHGSQGTSFIWNRSFFHRASPNSGPIRRRILKISIQSVGSPNNLIDSAEFRTVRSKLRAGTFLGDLFGTAPLNIQGLTSARTLVSTAQANLDFRPLIANSSVCITRRDLAVGRYLEARDCLIRKLKGTAVR
jgi:hypothetical protein